MDRPDTPAHLAVVEGSSGVPVELAGKAVHRLPCLSRRVIAEIRRQMKVYNAESAVVSDEDLAQSVTSNLRTLIDALCMPDEVDLSHARATGRRRARQGIPLAEVQRAFRIGFGALWDLLLDIEYERRTLADVAATFWYLFDLCLEAVGVGYREATAELARAQRRRRQTLLEVLFAGGVVTDSARWDITECFDLPLDGTFVVVVAETCGRAALPDAEQVLDEVRMGSAWRRTHAYELGIVSIGTRERVVGLIEILRAQATARVGISPAFTGFENTSRALRLAHMALASLPRRGGGAAACFEESAVSVLVAAAPEEARSIARDALGPVLRLPVADREVLLDTVNSWISNGGSTKRAARELYCHPNTVRYRLQRLQTELRMSLTDPSALAELVLALRAWQLLADTVPMPESPGRLQVVAQHNAS
jgi:PucR-like helix-turn-helix protein/diguanylate cyclase with GGDEF domain